MSYDSTRLHKDGTSLIITPSEGSEIEIKNYSKGDFGIILEYAPEEQPSINTDHVILGDQKPLEDEDGNIELDSWGNIIPDGDAPSLNDTINDTSSDDEIKALGGNDEVIRKHGGEDNIQLGDGDDDLRTLQGVSGTVIADGGSGDDYIGTGNESDVLEGGSGADGLYGAGGNDFIYGDQKGDHDSLIETGETQQGSGQRGEWVDAEDGDDQVFTGAGNDLLAGGDGNDLLVSGGGNDWIWGDRNTHSGKDEWRSWNVTETIEEDPENETTIHRYHLNQIYTESNDGIGDDQIYAGAGDDFVSGERGKDTIYLGLGNDKAWGGADDDTIHGGSGDDLINGDNSILGLPANEHGSDTLYGGAGNDEIHGGGSGDIIAGGEGDDALFGDGSDITLEYQGSDYIDGGAGNDKIVGRGGADILLGGAGADDIFGGEGDDFISGGAGNDNLTGDDDSKPDEFGTDTIDGGDGDDIIWGNGGSDFLYGGDGNDQLQGDSLTTAVEYQGDDLLDGGSGDDTLFGFGGNDTLYGGEDDDLLFGYEGDDTLDGGAGQDVLFGGDGNDTLRGGRGDGDYLEGGRGDDVYLFAIGDGDTVIDNSNSTLSLPASGVQGDDITIPTPTPNIQTDRLRFLSDISADDIKAKRQGDNLILTIVPSNETITIKNHFYFELDVSAPQNDLHMSAIEFADGSSWDTDKIEELVLIGTEESDYLSGTYRDDYISGLGGDYTLIGGAGNDLIYGGDGNDHIEGGAGNDQLFGDDGNDHIEGGSGDDILNGGAGLYDTLSGGAGNDTYLFAKGSGGATIRNEDDSTDRTDKLKLTGDITPDDVVISSSLNNLILTITSTGEKITVIDHFDNRQSEIDVVEFPDGTVWTAESIKDSLLTGSAASDTLRGFDSDDVLNGLEGDDNLYAEGGNDQITGGKGDDQIDGGAGDDTYIFAQGDGVDTITDDSGQITIQLTDQDFTNVLMRRSDTGLYISFLGNDSDGIRINHFYSAVGAAASRGLTFISADNSSIMLTPSEVDTRTNMGTDEVESIYGSHQDDEIHGYGGSDHLYGEQGNDALYGGDGSDVISGGDGDDQLFGGDGSDSLSGGQGNDTYHVGFGGTDRVDENAGKLDDIDVIRLDENFLPENIRVRYQPGSKDLLLEYDGGELYVSDFFNQLNRSAQSVESIEFADGTVWSRNDILDMAKTGYETDDDLIGFESDDILVGNGGNDNLVANAGNDRLEGGADEDHLYGLAGDDTLIGGTGSDHLDAGAGHDRYLFSVGDGDDTIVNNGANGDVDSIEFAQGILSENVHVERSANDLIVRYSADDSIKLAGFYMGDDASAGSISQVLFASGEVWNQQELLQRALIGDQSDNVITGYAYDDNLQGNAGDDTLRGGAGNDAYTFSSGDGVDIIDDREGSTTVKFEDVRPDQVLIRRDGDNFVLTYGTDKITLLNHVEDGSFISDGSRIETIEFSDNVSWNAADIRLQALRTTADQDYIEGFNTENDISGGDGNDQLFGGAADDSLSGDAGDDLIWGNLGNDTLEGGIGSDTLWGGGDNDNLQGQSGDDTLSGQEGNDTLSGGDHNDELLGGDGEDELYGDSGNDTLDGGRDDDLLDGGLGDDILTDIQGVNVLHGGEGSDQLTGIGELYGDAGDDVLEGEGLLDGGAGHDTLIGWGADTLRGGAGNDTLIAFSQLTTTLANTLEGGAGNDTLYGSFGNDTYLFNLGDGADHIIERRQDQAYTNFSPSEDILRFGEGIQADDLSFARHGDNMVISHSNGSDQITIENWFRQPTEHFKINRFEFADGSTLTNADLEALMVTYGTDGDDAQLHGYRDLNEEFRAGAGEDGVWSGEGNDRVYGDAGDDYLDGQNGDDQLFGGDDNDRLVGRSGNDTLDGGTGDDKYFTFAGDGHDVIDNSGGGYDVLFFQDGIDSDRLAFVRDGDDLLVNVDDGSAQSVRIINHFLGGDYAIDVIQPSSGYGLSTDQINQIVAASEVEGDFDSLIDGDANAGVHQGSGGNDLIRGFGGNDSLYGMSGDDRLEGGEGNDYLSGGNGINSDSGNDVLIGGAGDDTLFGEDGDDRLEGGAGNDRYYYFAGDGKDEILDAEDGQDILFFNDVSPDRLSYHQDGDDLIVLVDGDLNQQVRIKNHFLGGNHEIMVQPNGGYTQTAAAIAAQLTALRGSDSSTGNGSDTGDTGNTGGDSGSDQSGGDTAPAGPSLNLDGDDAISGTDQGEILVAGAGNDSIAGLGGNDRLIGGTGDDVYIIGAANGQDVIIDSEGQNIIRFVDGIGFNDVASGLMKSGNDLILRISGSSTNQVRISNFFSVANTIEKLEFEVGGQLTAAQLFGAFGLAAPTATLSSGELVLGDALANTLAGGDGHDLLFAGRSDDSLQGGLGNDQLIGGDGDDVYLIGAGHGQDTIVDTQGSNIIRFTDGIVFNDVASGLMKSGNDLTLRVGTNGDQVQIENFFAIANTIERLEFETGGQITAAQLYGAFGVSAPTTTAVTYDLLTDVIAGTDGQDTLTGSDRDDQLSGGAGDDVLSGSGGNDILIGETGNDVLDGGAGDDLYLFSQGDGQDHIIQNDTAGHDVLSLSGGVTTDQLWFSRQGDDLQINLVGSDDQVTVGDWYLSDGAQLDEIEVGTSVLRNNQVAQLVNAMAAFDVPSGAGSVISQSTQDALQPVLTAAWESR
ncbi:calcium-binding protein [Motiliproteus sp.]|uniref:calcium-binding protein n=1 Tax=Motiliproteus sp. TaxID=1898955 RepID=UPI003BAB9251